VQVAGRGVDCNGVQTDILDHAGELLERGRAGHAATLLAPVVGRDPLNVGAWLLLTRAHLALGRVDDALEAARVALRLEPSDVETLFWVSAAYSANGRHELAITAAEHACGAEPGHPRLLERHGRALLAAGRVADAGRVLQAGAEIAFYDADLHVAHGAALFAAARPAGAREAYGRALEIDPGHERARAELGRLSAAERGIVDAATLVSVADAYAESLRVPAGGVRRRTGNGREILAHVSAVVFGVSLVAVLGLAVLLRVTDLVVPWQLLVTLMCVAASAACVTTLVRRGAARR
jgi:Flp pilus assembly protein TadD